MLSALFFSFIVYKCLLLNGFYFPFSAGVGPGESGWEGSPLWGQQEGGPPPGDLSSVPALTREPVLEALGEDET